MNSAQLEKIKNTCKVFKLSPLLPAPVKIFADDIVDFLEAQEYMLKKMDQRIKFLEDVENAKS